MWKGNFYNLSKAIMGFLFWSYYTILLENTIESFVCLQYLLEYD